MGCDRPRDRVAPAIIRSDGRHNRSYFGPVWGIADYNWRKDPVSPVYQSSGTTWWLLMASTPDANSKGGPDSQAYVTVWVAIMLLIYLVFGLLFLLF